MYLHTVQLFVLFKYWTQLWSEVRGTMSTTLSKLASVRKMTKCRQVVISCGRRINGGNIKMWFFGKSRSDGFSWGRLELTTRPSASYDKVSRSRWVWRTDNWRHPLKDPGTIHTTHYLRVVCTYISPNFVQNRGLQIFLIHFSPRTHNWRHPLKDPGTIQHTIYE